MNAYENIIAKLGQFTKRYYTKLLIKGVLLFVALGLLFFIVTLSFEYFLWLSSSGRLMLLLSLVVIELVLVFRYILTPLFYLFKLKRGITNKEASLLIGKHFQDVDDKLYNLLDLAEDSNRSELLAASIEQRSESLKPVPFGKAIDFKENLKYLKYSTIPLLIFGLIWISGNLSDFFGSTKRIVNYDLAYEKPAPFQFRLLSNDLDVLNDKPHTIDVAVEGEVQPEVVYIEVDGKQLQLQRQNGTYRYTFSPPFRSTEFFFLANEVRSQTYRLTALETPAIENFELLLEYPAYTELKREVLKSTGNANFPEGTKVTWKIDGKNVKRVDLVTSDTARAFDMEMDAFQLSKRIYDDLSYEIATSNENIKDYERLAYNFEVVKDAYPSIKVKQVFDSLNPNISFYAGETSDDYLVRSIRLVCYADEDPQEQQRITLEEPNTNYNQFYYTFPSGLNLETGKAYSFYFEATDNDGIRNGKSAKSQVFSTVLLNTDELKNKALESQQSIINNMDRSLERFKEQKETLKEINQGQKEKNQLNFNDQNQIKDFLRKQQQQENMMQKFSKQLKENLEKDNKNDELNELLQERLERQEIEAKKNEKLLDELNKIADKIDKEELTKRLEELAKKQQNSERNLEQLLELTKRYYVTEKAAQLAKDLEKMAEKQQELSEKNVGEEYEKEEQEKLNDAFKELSKALEELRKDNEDLKKPMDLDTDSSKEDAVKEDQQDALEDLNKSQEAEPAESEKKQQSQKSAKNKQKSAAEKMKEMSEKLQQSSAGGGGGSSITEDAEMLRQILDNLVTFSFKQENLFDNLESAELDMPQFSGSIKKQQELRELFEHVDDSLFSLSLRRAELSEFVNEQITEVYYNTDKALESIAESQIYQGVSYQKYVLNAANELSDFLANILDNMQESMQSGEGEGEGQGFQLPDIIKSQGELKEKMEGQGQSGQGQPQQGQGSEGKSGESGEGKEGGKEGESGEEGKQGNSGEGERGKNGDKGEGEGGEKGSGKGNGKGQGQGEGDGGDGEQVGPSEQELKEIYEIYKEQQLIRQKLEEQLEDMINSSDRKLGEKLARQMEEFENDLLENGITQRGLNKMNTIQYELLKLKDAAMKQGKKPDRESNTNKREFKNPITTKPVQLQNYRNETEVLNRQALPLRQNYKTKVKEYFKKND